ncbi:hypothetical protein B7463_g606, partial [Scytalidium lignicola]
MASTNSEEQSGLQAARGTLETAPFVLRSLIEDLPLSADGDRDDIEINCVEYLDHNLYIGTSASELLHFFEIPSDPSDISERPSYILASRLSPAYSSSNATRPGVQQILLLPRVNKACILCNWTVTFYSLPELSPVFNTAQVTGCNWIGGLDLNRPLSSEPDEPDPFDIVLLSLRRKLRTIDFAGSITSLRRDSFACVADAHSYALLDVDRQLKIPLFPISSLDESQSDIIGGRIQDISGHAGGISRSSSSAQSAPSRSAVDDRGHGRSTSLGASIAPSSRGADKRASSGDRSGTPDLLREASPTSTSDANRLLSYHAAQTNKPLPDPPTKSTAADLTPTSTSTTSTPAYLKPHIVSPSPEEFLLVTGTKIHEPGVGLFVNLEGDVTRSTLQFDTYPDEVVVDGRGVGIELTPTTQEEEEEGFILASMGRGSGKDRQSGIEIQRWDLDPGENHASKYWLQPKGSDVSNRIGLRSTVESGTVYFQEVTNKLRLRRFKPFAVKSREASTLSLRSADSRTAASLERVSAERALFESVEGMPEGYEERRMEEELQFAQRLGRSKTHIVAWSKKQIWWVVRNPLALRLDASLLPVIEHEIVHEQQYAMLDRRKAIEVIDYLRGTEAKTETEFLSLIYMRQHAGLLLFMSILTGPPTQFAEVEYRAAEEALLEGGLDPRIILAILPLLRNEIIEGKTGMWVHGGIKDAADSFIQYKDVTNSNDPQQDIVPEAVLLLLKRFLTAWRRRKGFGSVANESEVFRSIDAALLVVLLRLDESSPRGPAEKNSIRAELNELVDHGLDCFERAVSLLEFHHRLYVLSRLYQSRRMAEEVLETWRRILEGEIDNGGELQDGEQQLREYLSKISNPQLVQKYGVWLAARNPKLGVQVFAEDRSRIKFEPTQVVQILREGAPSAVKDYLEHLVFGKNHTEYVNELIAYYLDIVINKLEGSEATRNTLEETYAAYRALRPPKPTYRQFITDNSIDEEWWHSRLRLLQLLGGSQGSASNYDVVTILERLTPFTTELVPEIIILKGRRSEHAEALRLLTHGLGDYDTAITYCLLEFLKIEDVSDRVEQTSSLLERFGGWFDVYYVLGLIPDSWSVEIISGFLVSALRRIVQERSETMIAKALSGSENLKTSADLIEKIKEVGPSVEA